MYLKILNWSRPKVKIEYRFPSKITEQYKSSVTLARYQSNISLIIDNIQCTSIAH